MADSEQSKRSRLTVDDWLEASMLLLVDEGVEALKISRLTSTLGVTKGSFYWHFPDIKSLKGALSEHCTRAHRDALADIDRLEELPPIARIEAMTELVSDPRRHTVESALRRWAESDEALAESVLELDRRVHKVAHKAMLDLGFDDAMAHARATTLLYSAIGYLHSRSRLGPSRPDDMRLFVDLLTTVPGDAAQPSPAMTLDGSDALTPRDGFPGSGSALSPEGDLPAS